MEKKVVRSLYTMEPTCLVCRSSEYLTQGCGGLSLSLSPLVTDPAAFRPPGERECGGLSLSHRWSLIRSHPVHRGKGSAVASLSLTVGH